MTTVQAVSPSEAFRFSFPGRVMQSAQYYRDQAAKALRLVEVIGPSKASAILERLACDYTDIAVDLENRAVEVVLPRRAP